MKKYIVRLTSSERIRLQDITNKGKSSSVLNKKARILLRADQSRGQKWLKDREIAEAVDTSVSTVERLRKRFVNEGFESSLKRQPLSNSSKIKFDGEVEAQLIALVTSESPQGRSRWTLQLLADSLVEFNCVESITAASVGNLLKKTNLSLGRKGSGV